MQTASVLCCPTRTAPTPFDRLLIRAFLVLWLVLLATPVYAVPLALMPGETRENIPAAGHVVQSSSPVDPEPAGVATSPNPVGTAVAFTREDEFTQIMYVYASDSISGFDAKVARGILFIDFCVPRAGAGVCDAVSDPTAPEIIVSLTFQFGVIGAAYTEGALADAKVALTGSVVDTEKASFVAFKDLLGNQLSSHGIQFAPISIDWVPIPLPNHTEATITQPVTFPAILIKRGRIYRFQLSAAATADGDGYADSYRTDCSFAGCERQRVMLRDVTITVNDDSDQDLLSQIENLKSVVAALQEQFGNLGARIDALEDNLQELISALNGNTNTHGRANPPHGPPHR